MIPASGSQLDVDAPAPADLIAQGMAAAVADPSALLPDGTARVEGSPAYYRFEVDPQLTLQAAVGTAFTSWAATRLQGPLSRLQGNVESCASAVGSVQPGVELGDALRASLGLPGCKTAAAAILGEAEAPPAVVDDILGSGKAALKGAFYDDLIRLAVRLRG
ncbi:MAG TPA: hypothetical protein PKD59_03545 [Miltoncostaeaceae bacterium]|nr:hypothetical protein [Miltoncostaeaceae bacterium]